MSEIKILSDVEVQLIDSMGDDQAIVQAARVSTKGANSVYAVEGSEGLIRYLMREKHGSPFEHVVFKFYVKAPIFVFREFHRHRMASYNEVSGRYSKLKPEFYIPAEDRPLKNVGTSAKPEFSAGTLEQHHDMSVEMQYVYESAWGAYEQMINDGIANEVARMVLPVGLFSEMYATMNLRSILNFLSLRTQREEAVHISRPQREIEMVAELMEHEVRKIVPIAFKNYNTFGRVAP